MPDIFTERIPDCPKDWAYLHPVITVSLQDTPYGWELEAWTQGRRILIDEDGQGATYSMEVPPAVTRAIYGWLNTVAPIWTSPWFTTHDTSIEWEDYDTGAYVFAARDTMGIVEVSMGSEDQDEGDFEAIAFLNRDGTARFVADDSYRKHIERVTATAHKYFYPN